MRRSSACSTQDGWRGRDWKLASRFAGECIRLGRSEEASPCSTGNGKEVGELVERGSIQRGGYFLVCFLFVCLFVFAKPAACRSSPGQGSNRRHSRDLSTTQDP